ncbi:MAG: diguanylate cyclase [Myxococcales bacterium]|nr:diguanylate cyclase [Myxococcales bacterium]
MPGASRRRLALRAGFQASALSLILSGAGWFALRSAGIDVRLPVFVWITAGATLTAGMLTRFYVQFAVSRRIARVVRVLDVYARERSLQRLPDLGGDEIGEIGRAVNALLANLTSLEVQMIEQDQELRSTREELALKRALGEKTAELEQRLRERALLFDIVRASASERELDSVLAEIATRLGEALKLRECMLFLVDAKTQRLTLRAAHGFEKPGELLERIVLFDEQPLGKAAKTGEIVVVDDLEALSESSLWEPIEQRGSMAILPVIHRGTTTGVLAVTRSETSAFSELETGLLAAISDQLGLAIRHTQLFDELRRGSQHDDLTGLGNRRLLRIRLEDELHRAQRFGEAVSVLAIDIDYFKALNDRHGHPTGDAALRKLAGLMTRNLRRIDTIARIGGEEFVVLLPRTNAAIATKVGEKLRSMVESTAFPGGEEQPEGALTVSVGVASLHSDETGADLLARADNALYEAKDRGRNCVVTASQPTAGSARSLTRSRI